MIRIWSSGYLLIAGAVAIVAALSINSGLGSAQTSGATPGTAPCTIEARTFQELVTMFAEATPAATVDRSGTVTVPIGQPAGEDAVEAVTATMEQAVACLNAGDFGRFLALLTPRAITTAFAWLGEELDAGGFTESLLLAPAPPDQPQSLIAIGDVTILADGRYTAVVIISDPTAETVSPTAMHLVLVQAGERLLIDEVAEFHESQ